MRTETSQMTYYDPSSFAASTPHLNTLLTLPASISRLISNPNPNNESNKSWFVFLIPMSKACFTPDPLGGPNGRSYRVLSILLQDGCPSYTLSVISLFD